MIENAAKMAGMPVGPLSLTDETAIDLAQKIMKQTIARSRRQGRRSGAHEARSNEMVDTHGRHGRKNGKGFYDYPAKPAKKHLWPGAEDALCAAGCRYDRLRGAAEQLPARHHRAGSSA
jgi:3-hydroxyacyl-CoA dehydrogenase/enoyl-CoA hydratase/3-hydroxybutyryl-CoA epimerase